MTEDDVDTVCGVLEVALARAGGAARG
jgi:hypothetical protein